MTYRITVGSQPTNVAVSTDGGIVYVTNGADNTLSFINTATDKVTNTIAVGRAPSGISVTPDGKYVYESNVIGNDVWILDAITGAIVNKIGASLNPYAFGSFITSGLGCTGTPITFTITVNPTSTAITASAATGTISACAGTASSSPNIQQFTVSGTGLSGNITATAPANFEVSLAPGSGYGNRVVIPITSGSVNNVVVYVRSAATASAGSISGNVTLTSAGVIDQTVAVAGTVNAVATASIAISASANNVCASTPITFTAVSTNGGTTPVYQWLVNGNNAGTNSATFNSSTLANGDVVTCVLTSSSACATPVTSNSVTMNVTPLPTVNGGGNKIVEKGNSIALTATASGDIADITWSPSTGLDNNKILNPKASPTVGTLYTITVQSVAGCIATDSVTVTVLDGIIIPNTFTPNGDGVNDKWDVRNLQDYANCQVQVFDRWGKLVFSSIGYGTPWDGTFKGRALPSGTYYYLINLKDGTPPIAGFVLLVR